MSDEDKRPHPFSRWEAHPFEEPDADGEAGACAFCGERRAHILHHPSRVRAACLLRGLDPAAVMTGRRRREPS